MERADTERWRTLLLDHAEAPRGRPLTAEAPAAVDFRDPATGDRVALAVELASDGTTIAAILWRASGSTVLRASASIMAEQASGLTPAAAHDHAEAFLKTLTTPEGDSADAWTALGDAEALQGIRHLPARVKCAALPWRCLLAALEP